MRFLIFAQLDLARGMDLNQSSTSPALTRMSGYFPQRSVETVWYWHTCSSMVLPSQIFLFYIKLTLGW
jgi:hypothetical protein